MKEPIGVGNKNLSIDGEEGELNPDDLSDLIQVQEIKMIPTILILTVR